MKFDWVPGRDGNGSLVLTPKDIVSESDCNAVAELLILIVNSKGLEVELTPDNITHLLEQAASSDDKVQIHVNCYEDEVGISVQPYEPELS